MVYVLEQIKEVADKAAGGVMSLSGPYTFLWKKRIRYAAEVWTCIVSAYMRLRYWILNDLKVICKEQHWWLICAKYPSEQNQQLMDDLSTARMPLNSPFLHCVVNHNTDVEGPSIKYIKGACLRLCRHG